MSTLERIRSGYFKSLAVVTIITTGIVVFYMWNINLLPINQSFADIPMPKQTNNHSVRVRPHILLIMADDLGYCDVGYHGTSIKTPYLDKLALSGVRLENYYVQRVCTPTRGQLLSGRYGIHTGLDGIIYAPVPVGLPLDSPTIADKLKEAGYATHIVGKWHVGFFKKEYLPTYRGFDSFFGIPTGHADYFKYDHGLRSIRGSMTGYALLENDQPANITKYSGNYSTLLYADKVKDIIRNHNADQPLFVFLSFQTPHTPLQVPETYLKKYKHYMINTRRAKLGVIGLHNKALIRHNWFKTIFFIFYGAMVTCMDDAIKDVVKTMKDRGLWDNTVLIFTTDNGGVRDQGSSNWPLKGGKGQNWEGGIRAVGFVHSNLLGTKAAGTVSRDLMHVSDWYPTLVNLAGGNLEGTLPLDGYDQWNTIKYGTESPRKEILIYIDSKAHLKNKTSKAAIRIGDWKLLTGYGGHMLQSKRTVFLVNIKDDPRERNDLSSQMPDKVERMLERIEYYRKGMPYKPYPTHDAKANPRFHNGFWVPWR